METPALPPTETLEGNRQLTAILRDSSLSPGTGSDWKTKLPHPAALLVGLGVGWEWSGLRTLICAELDPSATTVAMVAAVAFIAAAIGPRIPARFLVSVARLIRRQRSDSPTDGSFWLLRGVRDRDEGLLWLALAVLASLAGLAGVMTLPLVSLFASLHRYLLEEFFWTPLTLSILEWAAPALLIGGPWLINGLLVAALAPVIGARTGSRREQPGIAAGVLLGLGAALYVHDGLTGSGLSGAQAILLGALPMFALTVLAAGLSHRPDWKPPAGPPAENDMPELTGRAEGWIWLSLAAWAAGATLMISGWLACQELAALYLPIESATLGVCILSIGLGVAIGSLTSTWEGRWSRDCGTVLLLAGIASGATVVAIAFLPFTRGFVVTQMALVMLPLGYALYRVERAWLARAGSETIGFAQMTTALLAGAAIGLIVNRWWIEPALGTLGAAAGGALVLIAFGGLNQIHEGDDVPSVQRRKIALVFASLAAAIVVFPMSADRWTRWSRSLARNERMLVAPLPVSDEDLARIEQICMIGVAWQATIPGLDRFTGQIDRVLREGEPASPQADAATRGSVLTIHGFRLLELNKVEYDVIYQHGGGICDRPAFAGYSIEWFTMIEERTKRGGRIVVDVPLAGQTKDSVRTIAGTLARAIPGRAYWCVVEAGPSAALRLLALPEGSNVLPQGFPHEWRLIDCLFDADVPMVRSHSLRRDRLTDVLRNGDSRSNELLGWLAACGAGMRE